MSKSKARYDALVESHIAELEAWIAQDPSRWDADGRTIRQYCEEYSHRFAITADVASDMGYDRADRMLKELHPYEKWFSCAPA
jgi:hypothetical protein